MSQHLSERFEFHVDTLPEAEIPKISVHHARGANRAYLGETTCILTFMHKKRPYTVVGRAKVSSDESRPMTKRDGYRIATERAIKQYFRKINNTR